MEKQRNMQNKSFIFEVSDTWTKYVLGKHFLRSPKKKKKNAFCKEIRTLLITYDNITEIRHNVIRY